MATAAVDLLAASKHPDQSGRLLINQGEMTFAAPLPLQGANERTDDESTVNHIAVGGSYQ